MIVKTKFEFIIITTSSTTDGEEYFADGSDEINMLGWEEEMMMV